MNLDYNLISSRIRMPSWDKACSIFVAIHKYKIKSTMLGYESREKNLKIYDQVLEWVQDISASEADKHTKKAASDPIARLGLEAQASKAMYANQAIVKAICEVKPSVIDISESLTAQEVCDASLLVSACLYEANYELFLNAWKFTGIWPFCD